jgi:Flp pilus assembly protein TadG
MSKNAKIALVVIVLLVLAGGAYYWHMHTTQPQAAQVFNTASSTLPSGTSTTDQGLQQDAAAIDANLKGLSTDQATVNSAVSESNK